MRAVSSQVRMVERARIVLAAAERLKSVEIAELVGCSEPTMVKLARALLPSAESRD